MKSSTEFEQSYERVRGHIERLALFLTRDVELAQDLLQDALLTAYKHRVKIPDDDSLKAYVRAAVVRLHARQREVERRNDKGVDIELLEFNSMMGAQELAETQLVLDAIDTLSDDERIPFVLVYIEGYKVSEVGMMLELGESAVKMRLKRGRTKVRRKLGVKDPQRSEEQHG